MCLYVSIIILITRLKMIYILNICPHKSNSYRTSVKNIIGIIYLIFTVLYSYIKRTDIILKIYVSII